MSETSLMFKIDGFIKPYVRMTQKGKFVKPQALEYLDSKQGIKIQLQTQMNLNDWQRLPEKTPLQVKISLWTRKVHNSDCDNKLKAILDSANGIVYPDDRWIDGITIKRFHGEDELAFFTVSTL